MVEHRNRLDVRKSWVLGCLVFAVALWGGIPDVFAQAATSSKRVPLDVPYVPTTPEVVDRMLTMAGVGPDDYVIDLGSGDGRIAIAAVKNHGAKAAMGVDIDPRRIAEANENAKAAGVDDKVKFENRNLFETDFSDASVLTMYLLPDVNIALRPKILELEPGTRVVSHAFDMDEWESDEFERLGSRTIYMWIVPADLAGRWTLQGQSNDLELDLKQEFQMLSGTATDGQGKQLPVTGRVRGEEFELQVGEGESSRRYRGHLKGKELELKLASSKQVWRGSRQ